MSRDSFCVPVKIIQVWPRLVESATVCAGCGILLCIKNNSIETWEKKSANFFDKQQKKRKNVKFANFAFLKTEILEIESPNAIKGMDK